MRVIQTCSSWLPVTQRWIWVQLAHLPPGIESTVVTSRVQNPDTFPWPRLRAPRFPRMPGGQEWPTRVRRVLRWRLLRAAARETGARLVHSHFGPTGWEDLVGVRRCGLRQVVTFYGYDVAQNPRSRPYWVDRYRDLFASVDRVLCEGPHMARSIAELGCPEAKLRVHRLGVEVDRLAFAPRRLAPGEPLRVLMAAAFVEKKGFPYGVRAVARFAREHSARLTIIGDSRPGESDVEKSRILESIAAEGIERDVRMLGFVGHEVLAREMSEHHLFLQPSIHAADGDCEGGVPVALIEAAASGMALVSTTHCDIPEVVLQGRTGWLAPERDVDGLVQGLRRWVDRDDWEPVLVAARERIEAEFDARKQGERLAAIYQDVTAGRPC